MTTVKLKRVYETHDEVDGIRILVDRLWPRGVSKKEAKLDYWLKELGPSTELRKWFNHDQEKFKQFEQKYKEELKKGEQQKAFIKLQEIIMNTGENITLVYAAKDAENNHARVLKAVIKQKVKAIVSKSEIF